MADAAPGPKLVRRGRDATARAGVLLAVVAVNAIAHRGWFRPGIIAFGDWHYLVGRTTRDLFDIPRAIDLTSDFGAPNTSLQGYPFLVAIGAIRSLGADFSTSERLVFFFPFIVTPILTMAALVRRFSNDLRAVAPAALLYALNTYALIIGNNQLTVAMAYALGPWVVGRAIDLARAVGAGRAAAVARAGAAAVLVTSLSAVYEPRITLLGALAAFAASIVECVHARARPGRVAITAVLVGVALVSTQLYWLVSGAGSSGYVAALLPKDPFISFASVTHAMNLNHPFWTNGVPGIFTIEQPLTALFLLPPLVAIATWVLVRRDSRYALFGALALSGTFLVKGENPPLARFYGIAFDLVPGMRMFRDMSKFSLWTALGYSVLVGALAAHLPWSRRAIHRGAVASYVLVIAVIVVVPALPAFSQRQGGTLAPADYPSDLRSVHEVLELDSSFGRVLWVGVDEPFTYRTTVHPATSLNGIESLTDSRISGGNILDGLVVGATSQLSELGVAYVVIGDQLDGLTASDRSAAIARLALMSEAPVRGPDIWLFRLSGVAPRWSAASGCDTTGDRAARSSARSAHFQRVTSQKVAVSNLLGYDPNWILRAANGATVSSHRRTPSGFNCWIVDVSGPKLDVYLEHRADRTVQRVSFVSAATLFGCVAILLSGVARREPSR